MNKQPSPALPFHRLDKALFWLRWLFLLGGTALVVLAKTALLRENQTDTNRLLTALIVAVSINLLIGVLTLAISFWLTSRLPLPQAQHSTLLLPVALSTILIGLFVIISRKIAINQVLGYLVMENGIYVLGLALVKEIPALVELGVLLDAFVAVFVMCIATYHISREFEHLDADQLDTLRG